eukprot:5042953-Pyramimonas_sp.AAC.1
MTAVIGSGRRGASHVGRRCIAAPALSMLSRSSHRSITRTSALKGALGRWPRPLAEEMDWDKH